MIRIGTARPALLPFEALALYCRLIEADESSSAAGDSGGDGNYFFFSRNDIAHRTVLALVILRWRDSNRSDLEAQSPALCKAEDDPALRAAA